MTDAEPDFTTTNYSSQAPSRTITSIWAACYVISGISQPMIMTLCNKAGLADSGAQLYMFFYYLGPAALIVTLIADKASIQKSAVAKGSLIALYDILAQTLNYTGAGLAGPTLFAIIYSSVTIWTAIFSRFFLGRRLARGQWLAVFVVFVGLAITGMDSVAIGSNVVRGCFLVFIGSIMHGSAYVFNEAIMTVTTEQLTVRQNAAIQGMVACVALGIWQLFYTRQHFDQLIGRPAKKAGTTFWLAVSILLSFAVANLVHSVTFSHTLKFYPGGATSAGVMKGLQAVLVFVAAWILYCGRIGGEEMCFSTAKLISLTSVSGGVLLFGVLTEQQHQTMSSAKDGYERIDSEIAVFNGNPTCN